MITEKINHFILLISFTLIITLPLIFVEKNSGEKSNDENRFLATFPSIFIHDVKQDSKWTKDFEAWFNDHLGFRGRFLKINAKIQYKLFGRLTRKDLLIGKNNWQYYVTPEIIKDYQQLNLPSEEQIIAWGKSFEKMNNYLKNKHIPFIMMLNLDKKTIYSENYPDTILKVGTKSKINLAVDYLNTHTTIDLVFPKNELISAKSQATVYSPRVDASHWNIYGAFIGYLALMDKIKKYFPEIDILSWNDFDITRSIKKAKVCHGIKISENSYLFNLKKEIKYKQEDAVLDQFHLKNNYHYRFVNSNQQLPKILIIGDSYIHNFLLPYLAQSFSELIFIHLVDTNQLYKFIDIFKPDLVLYEVVERVFSFTPFPTKHDIYQ